MSNIMVSHFLKTILFWRTIIRITLQTSKMLTLTLLWKVVKQSASIRNIRELESYSCTDQLCGCRRQSIENCQMGRCFAAVQSLMLGICLAVTVFVKGCTVSIPIIDNKLRIGNQSSVSYEWRFQQFLFLASKFSAGQFNFLAAKTSYISKLFLLLLLWKWHLFLIGGVLCFTYDHSLP